jgi:phage terminase large subunit-like protein
LRATRLEGFPLSDTQYLKAVAPYAMKFHWMGSHGYQPHPYQGLFHSMARTGKIMRFRHLVAGRRGGKTLSAAWEVAYYCTHPEAFWMDTQGIVSSEKLWVWCITKTFRAGRPALLTFLEVLRKAGLEKDRDFTFNKTDRIVEFPNGTVVEFRSAENEDDLRGPGLHILWMDEAAFIPSESPYLIVSPALAQTKGMLITTTTPNSKNWYHDMWWGEEDQDPDVGSVEYWSIDSPYFPVEEWKRYQRYYHPLMFEQEFKASFDAMVGLDLRGDWLTYHTLEELEEEGYYNPKTRKYRKLSLYMAVDPAISVSERADHFAMALIGVADTGRVFLLETFKSKIDFADQLQMIHQWHMRYRPTLIGIESVAYQKVLSQQAARLSGLPPIVPMLQAGAKNDRIMGMSPIFKIGKISVLKTHRDFQHEWINFIYKNRDNEDDVLDAVEMALRTAGSLHAQEDITWNEQERTPEEQDWGRIGAPDHEEMFASTPQPLDDEFGDDW